MIDIGSSCVQRLLITLVEEKQFKWLNTVENITLPTLCMSRFKVQTLPVHISTLLFPIDTKMEQCKVFNEMAYYFQWSLVTRSFHLRVIYVRARPG